MYLVERYEPGAPADWPAEVGVQGAEGPGGAEPPIRHVLSTLIPADEISLSLFEAPSEQALAHALAASGLQFIRIVEAVVRGGVPMGPRADDRVGEQGERRNRRLGP
jgi:hypothetical protein